MRKKKRKIVVYFSMIIFLFLVVLIYLEINLSPAIQAIAEAKTKLTATRIINESVNKKVVSNINYQDIVDIHKDSQDRIVLMMPNTKKINQLAAETTLEIEKELNVLKSQGFSIPLGLVTGSTIFANTGPPINIVIVPVGTIDVNVMDEFVEAGINQTKHRIYLDIKTDLRVVVPLMSSTVSVSMQVPVTESIIIGPVPEWYMSFSSGETPAYPPVPPIMPNYKN